MPFSPSSRLRRQLGATRQNPYEVHRDRARIAQRAIGRPLYKSLAKWGGHRFGAEDSMCLCFEIESVFVVFDEDVVVVVGGECAAHDADVWHEFVVIDVVDVADVCGR